MDCFHGGALCLSCFLNLLAYLLLQVQFMFACCVFFGVTFEILTKTGGEQPEASLLYPHLTLQVQGRPVHPQGLSGALALLILFRGP